MYRAATAGEATVITAAEWLAVLERSHPGHGVEVQSEPADIGALRTGGHGGEACCCALLNHDVTILPSHPGSEILAPQARCFYRGLAEAELQGGPLLGVLKDYDMHQSIIIPHALDAGDALVQVRERAHRL